MHTQTPNRRRTIGTVPIRRFELEKFIKGLTVLIVFYICEKLEVCRTEDCRELICRVHYEATSKLEVHRKSDGLRLCLSKFRVMLSDCEPDHRISKTKSHPSN